MLASGWMGYVRGEDTAGRWARLRIPSAPGEVLRRAEKHTLPPMSQHSPVILCKCSSARLPELNAQVKGSLPPSPLSPVPSHDSQGSPLVVTMTQIERERKKGERLIKSKERWKTFEGNAGNR